MSDIFKNLEGHLKFSSLRHGVIASNIANVDTPGYRAHDVKFSETLSQALKLCTTHRHHIPPPELSNTHSRHIPSPEQPSASVLIEPVEQSHWGDQNNVELDMEVAKMTENAVFFQAASTLLSKNISMYKAAMRRS